MTLDKWLGAQSRPSTHNTALKRKADPSDNTAPTPQKRANANTSQKRESALQKSAKSTPPSQDPSNQSKGSSAQSSPATATQTQDQHPSTRDPIQTKPTLRITESTGDLFAAPLSTILVHACNCQGSWSAGIAAAFKQHYPNAYEKYASHCEKWTPAQLRGTAFLIPPGDTGKGKEHWVGCLFTSRRFGQRKDKPDEILDATKQSMEDLVRQVEELKSSAMKGEESRGEKAEAGEVWMCQINSGKFRVPWEKTRDVLESIGLGEGSEVTEVKVVSRD